MGPNLETTNYDEERRSGEVNPNAEAWQADSTIIRIEAGEPDTYVSDADKARVMADAEKREEARAGERAGNAYDMLHRHKK